MAGYTEEIAFWEAHLGEDSAIIAKMCAYGIRSLTQMLDHIETLKIDIRRGLT